jgi:hypothetical protein
MRYEVDFLSQKKTFFIVTIVNSSKLKCFWSILGGSPCHHSMAGPRVADGRDDLQLWRLAANILNKQPRTNDKGWSSSLRVGRGPNNPSP